MTNLACTLYPHVDPAFCKLYARILMLSFNPSQSFLYPLPRYSVLAAIPSCAQKRC